MNYKAWSDEGRVNVPEMMKLLKCSQGTAYRLCKDVLKEYHAQEASRAEQYGNTAVQMLTGVVTEAQNGALQG